MRIKRSGRIIALMVAMLIASPLLAQDAGEWNATGYHWLDVTLSSGETLRILASGQNDYDNGSIVIYVWRTLADKNTQRAPAYELHISSDRLERLQSIADKHDPAGATVYVR